MSLFISGNDKTEIFISIGEGCPTGCQSCSHTIKKEKNYFLKDIKQQIDLSNKLSDKNFSYFLYGTNNIKNINLNEIVCYLQNIERNYRIQISLETKAKDLEEILNKNKLNELVISKKINNKLELKNLIYSIKEFYNKKDIIINYDLLIDVNLISILEKILKINFEKNEDLTYSKKIGNIIINLRELYFINSKEKKIENLNINSCFAYESFKIDNNKIIINDHYEIDKDLNIVFHNPLCFIGNNKITNLTQKENKILSDFNKYKNHYLEKLNSDFENNCFKCISTGFKYNEN